MRKYLLLYCLISGLIPLSNKYEIKSCTYSVTSSNMGYIPDYASNGIRMEMSRRQQSTPNYQLTECQEYNFFQKILMRTNPITRFQSITKN